MISYLKKAKVRFNGEIYNVMGGHLVNGTADLQPLSDKRRRVNNVSWALLDYVEEEDGAQKNEHI